MNWSEIKTKVSFVNTDTGKRGEIIYIGQSKGKYHYAVSYEKSYGIYYQYTNNDTPLPERYKVVPTEEKQIEKKKEVSIIKKILKKQRKNKL